MATFVAAAMPDEAPSAEICLHPLVIMNISDQATRSSLPTQPTNAQGQQREVFGLLFGLVSLRRLEILTSFEALMNADDGKPAWDLLKGKKERMSTVFPQYDVVGWYKTGESLTSAELCYWHNALKDLFGTDAPLVLLMNTRPASEEYTLPVYIFETTTTTTSTFIPRRVAYSVESEETERIGVETAMNATDRSDPSTVTTTTSSASSSSAAANPPLIPQADRLRQALRMLHRQISIVLQYLVDVKAGKVSRDSALLRAIASLCNQLPCGGTPSFTQAASREYEDTLLTVYLGMLSKQQRQLEQIVAKNLSMKSSAVGRRVRQFW